MFTYDDSTGEALSVTLGPPGGDDRPPSEVWFCASNHIGIQVYVLMDAAHIRGLITELSAMADELDTAQLEAETAAAEREAAADGGPDVTNWCWYEWHTAAGHLTACAEPRYHAGPHRDALGLTRQLRPGRRPAKAGQ